MAGEIPSLMPSGIASTIFSRTLSRERIKKMTPSIKMMQSMAWKDSTYPMPVITTRLAIVEAMNELRPIPGARQKGLLARNAITNIATAEARQVAKNTPFHSS